MTIERRNEEMVELYFDKESKPDTCHGEAMSCYFLLISKLKASNQNSSKHQEVQFHQK